MNFAGRWIPMELANSLFTLYAIGVVILGAIVCWFWRARPPDVGDEKAPRRLRHRKRDRRRHHK